MTKQLMRRLQRLEKTLEWRERAVPTPSAAPQFEAYLASKGIFREGSESLAETTARAFGWTIPQLRAALMQRGAGLPLNV